MTSTSGLRRYYDNSCHINKELDLRSLNAQLHALYTYWVAEGWFRRDFVTAVDHVTALFMCYFFMEPIGAMPSGEKDDCLVKTLALAQYTSAPEDPKKRFYDDDGGIAAGGILERVHKALAPHFMAWCTAGWHPRDFSQAARDGASVVVYDHELCCSFEGLGGGKTSKEFLATPFGH
jgi:hypothetical protein